MRHRLRTSEGGDYALENINPYIIEGKVTTGQRVKTTGLLRSGIDTGFDTAGIIHVTSVDKLNQNSEQSEQSEGEIKTDILA